VAEEASASVPLTPADERFSHQLVAPGAMTQPAHPAWAERCYHLVHVDDDLIVNAGRAVYPHGGRRTAFAGVVSGTTLHARRALEHFAAGDDPDRPDVGPLRIEVVRPLREVRLALEDPAFPVAFDLTYVARFPPVGTERNLIEVRGEVVTDYMNFFQSGRYSGTIRVDGAERVLRERAGFRDRGWGLRKHEGSPRRGFVLFCGCELPDAALYALLYETASGRRAMTNGWLLDERGTADRVTSAEHDLTFDGTLLRAGRLELAFASGARRELDFEVRNRLHLSAVGYTSEPASPGADRHDLSDPDVVARLDGQNDHGCRFALDGVEGHGYVETGLGTHARYRPEAGAH
jgi:hypothetical protein